jgi:hypothetical protein
MNKIKSWTSNKTNIIRIDDKNIVAVDNLPDDIRFDIETYDKFRQEYLNLFYEQEKLHHAVNGKLASIINKIKNYYNEQQKQEQQPTGEGEPK